MTQPYENSLEKSKDIRLETIITAGDLNWRRRIQPTTKGDFPAQKTLQERNAKVLPKSSH